MRHLKQISEAYLGPYQASMIKLFRGNCQRLLFANYFRKKSVITDVF